MHRERGDPECGAGGAGVWASCLLSASEEGTEPLNCAFCPHAGSSCQGGMERWMSIGVGDLVWKDRKNCRSTKQKLEYTLRNKDRCKR